MITLNTPVQIPNVTRIRCRNVEFDEDAETAILVLEALSPPATGFQYPDRNRPYRLAIANGDGTPEKMSQKLARNGSSASYTTALVEVSQVDIPNGFTALRSAWYGAGVQRAARLQAAETWALAAGAIDASLAGVVS